MQIVFTKGSMWKLVSIIRACIIITTEPSKRGWL